MALPATADPRYGNLPHPAPGTLAPHGAWQGAGEPTRCCQEQPRVLGRHRRLNGGTGRPKTDTSRESAKTAGSGGKAQTSHAAVGPSSKRKRSTRETRNGADTPNRRGEARPTWGTKARQGHSTEGLSRRPSGPCQASRPRQKPQGANKRCSTRRPRRQGERGPTAGHAADPPAAWKREAGSPSTQHSRGTHRRPAQQTCERGPRRAERLGARTGRGPNATGDPRANGAGKAAGAPDAQAER